MLVAMLACLRAVKADVAQLESQNLALPSWYYKTGASVTERHAR